MVNLFRRLRPSSRNQTDLSALPRGRPGNRDTHRWPNLAVRERETRMSDVVDDGWGEAGVSTLRWLFAEALADYQVWENLPADITIEWYNAHRWDLRVTAPSGRQTLINVKRCWAHSATYLGFGGPIEPHQSVHYIALVQLEDLDALWSRDPGGRIRLTAGS